MPEPVAAKVTRTRHADGLDDRITDDALIERVAAMVRATPRTAVPRPPAREVRREPEPERFEHAHAEEAEAS
jgi:hypothetical protein